MADSIKRTFAVGLTGGIASGKSTVARRFAALEIPLTDADELARQLVTPGTPALLELKEKFGAAILQADGSLNRKAMREIAFTDPQQRRALESILHPRIRRAIARRIASVIGPYHVIVVPLLAESGPLQDMMQRIVVVDADPKIQLRRLLDRDALTPELARSMIASQADRTERLAIADDVIDNNGTQSALDRQVRRLHHKFLQLSKPRNIKR